MKKLLALSLLFSGSVILFGYVWLLVYLAIIPTCIDLFTPAMLLMVLPFFYFLYKNILEIIDDYINLKNKK